MCLLVSIFAATLPLAAQSRSIYGAGVDDAAVLVRLVNAGAPGPTEIRVGALKLSAQKPGDATPYRPTAADIYVLSYAGKRYEFLPEAGSYYSLIVAGSALVIANDAKHTDPAKAQLYFYNMTAKTQAELRTADGATKVAGPCAAGSSAQVAVNPISATLAVFKDGVKDGADIPVRLERGSSLSIFAYAAPAGIAVFTVKATVLTE